MHSPTLILKRTINTRNMLIRHLRIVWVSVRSGGGGGGGGGVNEQKGRVEKGKNS